MAGRYVFDKESFSFKKVTYSVWGVVRTVLKYSIAIITLSVIYYVVGSLFISTDMEKRLRRENRAYEKEYARMREEERLLADVVKGLQVKDDGIYEQIFHTSAPMASPSAVTDYSAAADTVPDRDLVSFTAEKASRLVASAAEIEASLQGFTESVLSEDFVCPPLGIPVKDLSYSQIGASVGMKINPFYKVPVQHNGLDLLMPQGTDVFSTASGTVTEVEHSRQGQGNVVALDHGNGWVTRYSHLADISVSRGQKVPKGKKIGTVGMTGSSFAPHLHYEVIFNGTYCDPVCYLLDGVGMEEYADNVYMSINTEQSMD
ncbi:MAG: peptidoglycan DD-metalloendopeptidase family protein [Bacteroidales bacterium]|nr:peptidoglycan DD-metalloendopeptidase family protein [Bacteroidales bacterium]